MYDSQLVVQVHVYDSEWNSVGIATPAEALELEVGVYYFWVERILRTGRFSLYIGSTPQTTDDPYYTPAISGLSFISILSIFSLSLVVLAGYKIHKRRK